MPSYNYGIHNDISYQLEDILNAMQMDIRIKGIIGMRSCLNSNSHVCKIIQGYFIQTQNLLQSARIIRSTYHASREFLNWYSGYSPTLFGARLSDQDVYMIEDGVANLLNMNDFSMDQLYQMHGMHHTVPTGRNDVPWWMGWLINIIVIYIYLHVN